MGSKGGGTNTVTNNAAPPPEVMAQYRNVINQANAASATPLQQYQGNIVAPFNPAQNQAFQEVQNAQGAAQPYFNQAQGLIQNASQQITPMQITPSVINQYTNPYTQDVINSTLANINQQNAGQQSQLMGNAAAQGAWGGDRSAVAQALLANQQDLAKNQTIVGLESQGYAQALGEANTQQQQQLAAQEASQYLGQQGGFGLMNLGNAAQTSALSGASAQLQAGGLQQQLAQEQLNVPYQQFLQQQAYPYQNIGWLSGISTGLGSGMGGTSSTTSPGPSTVSQLGGLGLTGLGIYGAAGGFTGSANAGGAGLARGGHVSGLIKRLNNGDAVMMPAHYDTGGIIPGQITQQEMLNTTVPDLSVSYIPNAPSLVRGPGVSMMKPEGSISTTKGTGTDGIGGNPIQDVNAARGLAKLMAPSATGASAYDASSMASAFPGGAGGSTGFYSMPMAPTAAAQEATGLSAEGSGASALSSPVADQFGSLIGPSSAYTIPDVGASLGAADAGFGSAAVADTAAASAPAAATAAASDAGLFSTLAAAADSVWAAIPTMAEVAAFFANRGGAIPYARGGLIKHYDDGGMVWGGLTPFDTSTNPMANRKTSQYAQMPIEQLHQLATRIPPTTLQGQQIQKVIQQKQMMPNVGAGIATPSLPMATLAPQQQNRGGLIKGYDDGGDVTDNTPSAGLVKADPTLSTSAPTYTPTAPINQPDPWLALAAAGASMMASKSPHALEALGQGAEAGLQNYGQQKKEAAQESYQQGNLQKAAEQLAQEAAQHKDQLSLEQQKEAAMEKYQQGELGIRSAELHKPELVKDMLGNPIGWATPGSTAIKPLSGLPNYMGATGNPPITPTDSGAPAIIDTGSQSMPASTATTPSLSSISSGSAGKRLNSKLINSPASDEVIDSYFAQYPPAIATHAEKIASGEEQWPTGFATKNPILMQAATLAAQINPNITQAAYPTFLNFANGQKGNIARSLNVATAHLDTLDKLSTALDNGDTQLLNRISNTFEAQFGKTPPTNFNTAKKIVADEITKAVIGAGGTGADREEAAATINRANSPAQLREAISTYKTLMGGQLQGLQQQYEGATGRNDFQQRILTPAARESLNQQSSPSAVSSKAVNWIIQDGKLVQSP